MTMNAADFDYVRQLLIRRSGISLVAGKEYLVESRLAAVAQKLKLPSAVEVIAQLRRTNAGPIVDAVIEAMTTNETSFFRDVYPFEMLRDVVIPERLKVGAPGRPIHIWCGASSTGQEPYTIAIVLRESFGVEAANRFRIVATDISLDVLERAKEGVYSQFEVNRGLSPQQLARHFEQVGSSFRVRPEVKKMIEFKPVNLVEAWPDFPTLDIVFLRNVLIYFEDQTKRVILSRINKLLAPRGFLFLGGAETTMGLSEGFERRQLEKAVVYQRQPTQFTRRIHAPPPAR